MFHKNSGPYCTAIWHQLITHLHCACTCLPSIEHGKKQTRTQKMEADSLFSPVGPVPWNGPKENGTAWVKQGGMCQVVPLNGRSAPLHDYSHAIIIMLNGLP